MSSEQNREVESEASVTKRPINPGAEKWLGVPIPVLDHGFLYLVDYMGNDQSVAQAARVSYREGTKKTSGDEGLIRYLRRNRHTSPFEMAEMVFHAKMPIVVARQWVRHRTASLNEESARYSILSNEFYIPEPSVIAIQSKNNKQGRGEAVSEEFATQFRLDLEELSRDEYAFYQKYLNDDGTGKPVNENEPMVARELARLPLGVDIYTQWYWKCDLHNIFHFLGLRMDPHAQWEIRQYADAMAKIVSDSFPIAWKAFEDYELHATQLSAPEKDILGSLLSSRGVKFTEGEILNAADSRDLKNKREREEMVDKLKALGLIE